VPTAQLAPPRQPTPTDRHSQENPRTEPEQPALFRGFSCNLPRTSRNKRRGTTQGVAEEPRRSPVCAADRAADRRLEEVGRFYARFGEFGRPNPPPLTPEEEDFRHRPWKRRRAAVAEALTMTGKRRERFLCCGSCARVLIRADGQDVKLIACKCRDRWCDPCRFETASLVRKNLERHLFDRRRGRTRVFRAITLTLKSRDEHPRASKQRIFKAFRRLRAGKWWKRMGDSIGGAPFFELTLSKKTMLWHPHLHIIHEGPFMPVEELRAEWHRVTGDSFIVDVRIIDDDKAAAREVAKYASKGVTSPEDDPDAACVHDHPAKLREAMEALQGLRLCATYGSWRGFKLLAKEKPADNEWRDVGRLDEIIARARAGDVWATGLLLALEERRPHYAKGKSRDRPPPGS
jgi:hypothetical protein